MKRAMQRRLVGVLCLVLSLCLATSIGWAQQPYAGSPIGEVCFRMLSFDDSITLNVTEFNLPEDVPGFYMFGAYWRGESPIGSGNVVYEMWGNGKAGYNSDGDVFTLDMSLWNTSPYFGNHPVCRVNAVADGTLEGRWWMDCGGFVPPTQGGTPFGVQGTLRLIAMGSGCEVPQAPSAVARFGVQSTGTLAGISD